MITIFVSSKYKEFHTIESKILMIKMPLPIKIGKDQQHGVNEKVTNFRKTSVLP